MHPILIFYFWWECYICWKTMADSGTWNILLMPINVLSRNTPDAARSVHMVPFLYVMIASGMVVIRNGCRRLPTWKVASTFRFSLFFWWTVFGGVALFASISGKIIGNGFNGQIFFVRQPAVAVDEYDRWLRDTKTNWGDAPLLSLYEWRAQLEWLLFECCIGATDPATITGELGS